MCFVILDYVFSLSLLIILTSFFGVSGIKAYVISMACFFLLITLGIWSGKTTNFALRIPEKYEKRVLGIATGFFILVMFVCELSSYKMLGKAMIVEIHILVIIAVLLVLAFIIISKKDIAFNMVKISRWVVPVLCICIIFFLGMKEFKPIVLRNSFNYEAYWQGPYSIYLGHAIDDATASYYGHYGILLYPFFKLLGFNYWTISIIAACEGG